MPIEKKKKVPLNISGARLENSAADSLCRTEADGENVEKRLKDSDMTSVAWLVTQAQSKWLFLTESYTLLSSTYCHSFCITSLVSKRLPPALLSDTICLRSLGHSWPLISLSRVIFEACTQACLNSLCKG